jgi:predicted enzyme related to lactoylglutathione lyase
MCTITVHDVDETLRQIVDLGGTVHFPKSTIPGVCDIATFFDTEDNYFCIARYLEYS